ncbi:serpin-ZXA-like [Magnolia sinica]|uniref:serpin-ZXA-like n=1 Tax=Magnolia sinica TaxID=86752 RepID=UPI00265885A9|nr:serpin-ZXA-like [Magnolia sinica]
MLVLANAIYFKGAWSSAFDVSKTQDSAFYLLDVSIGRVAFMMSNKKKHFLHCVDGFKVLKLPYQEGNTNSQTSWVIISSSGKLKPGRVQLPRFKISFRFKASGIMKELGLYSPYSEQGGLTEMVDYHELSQRYSTSHLLQLVRKGLKPLLPPLLV